MKGQKQSEEMHSKSNPMPEMAIRRAIYQTNSVKTMQCTSEGMSKAFNAGKGDGEFGQYML